MYFVYVFSSWMQIESCIIIILSAEKEMKGMKTNKKKRKIWLKAKHLPNVFLHSHSVKPSQTSCSG